MAFEYGAFAVFAGAIATFAVAIFILVLDFQQRVHRALALLLILRAIIDAILFFEPSFTNLPGRLRVYFYIAAPFAAIYFAAAYRRRHRGLERSSPRRLSWVLPTLAAAIFEILYLVNHSWYGTARNPGPLFHFNLLLVPTFAAIALVFVSDFARSTRPLERKALRLAALGFSAAPLYTSVFNFSLLWIELQSGAVSASSPRIIGSIIAGPLTLLLCLTVAIRLFMAHPATDPMRWRFAGASAAAIASALALALAHLLVYEAKVTNPYQMGLAIWGLALPVTVIYALVRHRLFNVDVRLRFAVKGSTLAAIFVGVFFVVSEGAQQFFGEKSGNQYYGIAAAGLLVFAIAPLQRLADRVASRAVPGTPLEDLPNPQRVDIYREQLEICWEDGMLSRKDRIRFERLRQRLNISPTTALGIEGEILAAAKRTKRRGQPGQA